MRGRRVLFLSLAVVAVGVMVALGAFYLDPARAAVGPMPGVGLSLPRDTRTLTGIDVRRFVASPFYQRFARTRQQRPQAFSDLEARTGISPERDVDQLLISGQSQAGATAVAIGRFDRGKVSKALEMQRDVSVRTHEGRPVYVYRGGTRASSAVAFLADDTLVFGTQPEVEKTITSHAQGRGGLRDNAELMALLQSVRPGATFWTAGDQALLSQMPSAIPGPGGSGSLSLPGMKSVVVTGDLDPSVSFEAIAQANDDAAARQLADVVRGLIALATLQGSQNPHMQQLASALTVTNEASRVRVNGRLSYELLESLQRPQKGAVVVPGKPMAPAR